MDEFLLVFKDLECGFGQNPGCFSIQKIVFGPSDNLFATDLVGIKIVVISIDNAMVAAADPGDARKCVDDFREFVGELGREKKFSAQKITAIGANASFLVLDGLARITQRER